MPSVDTKKDLDVFTCKLMNAEERILNGHCRDVGVPFFRLSESGKFLGVPPQTLQRFIRENEISFVLDDKGKRCLTPQGIYSLRKRFHSNRPSSGFILQKPNFLETPFVVSFAGFSKGSGKTVMSFNVAVDLVLRKGLRVLLVDGNRRQDLFDFLRCGSSLYKEMSDDIAIYKSRFLNLDFLYQGDLLIDFHKKTSLRKHLESSFFIQNYDVILMDFSLEDPSEFEKHVVLSNLIVSFLNVFSEKAMLEEAKFLRMIKSSTASQKDDFRIKFMMNRVSENIKPLTSELISLFSGDLLPEKIHENKTFAQSMGLGLSIHEDLGHSLNKNELMLAKEDCFKLSEQVFNLMLTTWKGTDFKLTPYLEEM